jgi:ankyrin repeat protein
MSQRRRKYSTDTRTLLKEKTSLWHESREALDKGGVNPDTLDKDIDQPEFEGRGVTRCFAAAENNDANALRLLINNGADPEIPRRKDRATPAYIAAQKDCEEALKVLIAHKVDLDQINHIGATPIMAASANDKTTCLRLLRTRGADVNATRSDGASALYLAGIAIPRRGASKVC